MIRLEFRHQAEKEIADAAAWYEEQAPGVGVDFLKAVDAALGAIVQNSTRIFASSAQDPALSDAQVSI